MKLLCLEIYDEIDGFYLLFLNLKSLHVEWMETSFDWVCWLKSHMFKLLFVSPLNIQKNFPSLLSFIFKVLLKLFFFHQCSQCWTQIALLSVPPTACYSNLMIFPSSFTARSLSPSLHFSPAFLLFARSASLYLFVCLFLLWDHKTTLISVLY